MPASKPGSDFIDKSKKLTDEQVDNYLAELDALDFDELLSPPSPAPAPAPVPAADASDFDELMSSPFPAPASAPVPAADASDFNEFMSSLFPAPAPAPVRASFTEQLQNADTDDTWHKGVIKKELNMRHNAAYPNATATFAVKYENAVLYAALRINSAGLRNLMSSAITWDDPITRYKKSIRKKQDLVQNKQQMPVKGRPSDDGITEPLVKAYKRTIRQWYRTLQRSYPHQEDPDLRVLQVNLIETTNKFCSDYRERAAPVRSHNVPTQTKNKRVINEATKQLQSILKEPSKTQYIFNVKKAMANWWSAMGQSNNIMTKKLFNVKVEDILSNSRLRCKEAAKGSLSVMVTNSDDYVTIMFQGVSPRHIERIIEFLRIRKAHIHKQQNQKYFFDKLYVQSFSVISSAVLPSDISSAFCSYRMNAKTEGALRQFLTAVKLEKMQQKLNSVESCRHLKAVPSVSGVQQAETLRSLIQTKLRKKLGKTDLVVVLGTDLRKGCQVHVYRGVGNKFTLSFNPTTKTTSWQIRDTVSLLEATLLAKSVEQAFT